MKKKLTIVVVAGKVESVFTDADLEVEIIDLDSSLTIDDIDKVESLGNYVNELRDNPDLKEIVC